MEKIEIRTIHNREELEQAYQLWEDVFPENRAFFQERVERVGDYDMNTTWIAKVDGVLAACVQIFPYHIHYGSDILKVGGIGNVATLPRYRGKGLTKIILKRQTEWMVANGFDLSLLSTGINGFYEKLGWETIPCHTYILKNVPEIQDFEYKIVESTKTDREEIKRLYDEFSKRYNGIMIRSTAYWDGLLKKQNRNHETFLVAKIHNEVVAYARYSSDGKNVVIEECCYQQQHQEAVLALLKEIVARNEGYDSIRISFAGNHELTRYFLDWTAEVVVNTANMWKVINVYKLMEKVKGAFAESIPYPNCRLLYETGNGDFLVMKEDGFVHINRLAEPFYFHKKIKCSKAEFIWMLLNGSEVHKATEHLKGFFPKGFYQFWSTDAF